MLVEDVFESLRTETHIAITLEELSSVPATCLRAFDHLLSKLESSRHNFKASEGEARAKVSSELSHRDEVHYCITADSRHLGLFLVCDGK